MNFIWSLLNKWSLKQNKYQYSIHLLKAEYNSQKAYLDLPIHIKIILK